MQPTGWAFRSRTQPGAVGPVTSSSHRYGSPSGPSGARLILPVSPPGADLAHASADRVTATGPPGAQPGGGGRGVPDGGCAAGAQAPSPATSPTMITATARCGES